MQFLNCENQKTKMTKQENGLIWLYCKTWGKFGDHVIEEKGLWNFGADDLETIIKNVVCKRKKKNTEEAEVEAEEDEEEVEALTDLIMEKFEHDRMAFNEWSATIHSGYIASLPTTPQQQQSSPTVVEKILEWDHGKYVKL